MRCTSITDWYLLLQLLNSLKMGTYTSQVCQDIIAHMAWIFRITVIRRKIYKKVWTFSHLVPDLLVSTRQFECFNFCNCHLAFFFYYLFSRLLCCPGILLFKLSWIFFSCIWVSHNIFNMVFLFCLSTAVTSVDRYSQFSLIKKKSYMCVRESGLTWVNDNSKIIKRNDR